MPGKRIEPVICEIEGKRWNTWPIFEDESVTCVATELLHHVPTFGYTFQEPQRKGLMDKSKLRDLGLLNSPLCGKLARGQSVEQNGEIILPEHVMKPPQPGRKVAVLGRVHLRKMICVKN